MSKEEIANQLRARRKELRLSQQHLADLAGISPNSLYKIESGEGNPTLEVLLKLMEVLGLEIRVGIKS